MNRICQKRFVSETGGFTLLEVLIALTVFSVGLLAVATMQVTAIQGNALGGEFSQAVALVREQMETLKTTDFDSLTTGTTPDSNNPIDENGNNGGIFTRSWTIAANTTHSRMVTVTVTWTQRGIPHTVTLSSLTRGGGS